jgi:hypothetical protein
VAPAITFVLGGICGFLGTRLTMTKSERMAHRQKLFENSVAHRKARPYVANAPSRCSMIAALAKWLGIFRGFGPYHSGAHLLAAAYFLVGGLICGNGASAQIGAYRALPHSDIFASNSCLWLNFLRLDFKHCIQRLRFRVSLDAIPCARENIKFESVVRFEVFRDNSWTELNRKIVKNLLARSEYVSCGVPLVCIGVKVPSERRHLVFQMPAKIGNVIKGQSGGCSNIGSRCVPDVFRIATNPQQCDATRITKIVNRLKTQVYPCALPGPVDLIREDSGFSASPGLIGAGLGMPSSLSSEIGRSNSRGQSKETYGGPGKNQPVGTSSPIGRFLSGVRCFPLSAKIGLTIILSGLAWGIVCFAFIQSLATRTYFLGLSLGLLGLVLWLLPVWMWW